MEDLKNIAVFGGFVVVLALMALVGIAAVLWAIRIVFAA
jgi:hypothetical protein